MSTASAGGEDGGAAATSVLDTDTGGRGSSNNNSSSNNDNNNGRGGNSSAGGSTSSTSASSTSASSTSTSTSSSGTSRPALPAAHDYLATMLAGASGGCFARTFTYPIDTCKSRIMVRKTPLQGPGALRTASRALRNEVRAIAQHEGARGFYRGFSFAFFGSVPAGMLYFTCYEAARDALEARGASPAVTALAGGFVAEALSCVLWVPLDVLKERMQTQTVMAQQRALHGIPTSATAAEGTAAAAAAAAAMAQRRQQQQQQHKGRLPAQAAAVEYTSSLKFARDIFRTEGLRGLYRGYGPTLWSFGPFSALYFVFYEQCKAAALAWERVGQESELAHPTLVFGASGVASGAAAAFLTNPLDVVKVRVQVERRGGGLYGYTGLLDGVRTIFQTEGAWRGLFRGAGTRMLFQAPTTAIGFATFENFKLFYADLLARPS